jgi:hypothetical protein
MARIAGVGPMPPARLQYRRSMRNGSPLTMTTRGQANPLIALLHAPRKRVVSNIVVSAGQSDVVLIMKEL